MKKIRKRIYDLLKIKNISLYGRYSGSNNIFNKFLWNMLFIGRLYHRLIGKTLFIFLKKFNKAHYDLKNTNLDVEKNFQLFKQDGCVVIESFFSENDIDRLNSDYLDVISKLKNESSSEMKHIKYPLKIKDSLIKIWLNKNLIGLIKNLSSNLIFARNYPLMTFSSNWEDQLPTKHKFKNNFINSKYNDDWHIDHANLFNIHVLLEDLSENDLCMEYLAGSHKLLNSTDVYSDEEIASIKNLSIKKCYGKKGTVYIHYGNTLHRMRAVKNSERIQLHFEFTSKTNIHLNSENLSYCLSDNYNLKKLNSEERKVLSGIFPISLEKGYSINKKGEFKKTNSKII